MARKKTSKQERLKVGKPTRPPWAGCRLLSTWTPPTVTGPTSSQRTGSSRTRNRVMLLDIQESRIYVSIRMPKFLQDLSREVATDVERPV